MKLVAACAFGLEGPVKWELRKLGFDPVGAGPGRIKFDGEWSDIAYTNLWLRTADRVLVEVAEFDAPDFDALFETLKAMSWQDWLPQDAKFPVTARSRLSQLTSLPAIQRASKKAIVESMLTAYDGTLPETGPEFRIDISILNDKAAVTVDTTGPSLHKRGYRRSYGEAPLKETLAAALVMLSVWNPERPLIDPFCGSGTIPIEAVMIGRNIAPGMNRTFSFQDWPQCEKVDLNDCLERGKQCGRGPFEGKLQISATDIDDEVLRFARINAEKAGVVDDIHFQQKPFDELRSKREYGCVIANPPYGERLGEQRRLKPLYQSFPAVLQRLPTWSHFVLTSFNGFQGLLQKSADRRRKLYNGRIECTYYQFLGPKPPRNVVVENDPLGATSSDESSDQPDVSSPDQGAMVGEKLVEPLTNAAVEPAAAGTAVPNPRVAEPVVAAKHSDTDTTAANPVFGGLTDKDHEQAELFAARLKKRARHLRRWPTKKEIGCFRLYERDIPELPFVVDRYEDQYHMTEYERPHDRDPGRHAAWLELMKKTVAKTFELPVQLVHLKTRLRQKGSTQHDRVGSSTKKLTVNEAGLKFLVNLTDYIDTGLFLDHRLTRAMVMKESEGKDFLNLFAYTGAFSVYAAAGGATSTATVDWSNTYLDWARENMKLNGFDGSEHEFARQDSLDFLAFLPDGKKFGLVVVDPPTFSNSKRTEKVWDVQIGYAELLERLAKRVVDSGVVYFSTNFRKFKFDESSVPSFECREISNQTVPEDFRNRRIHRCWRMVKKP